MAVSCNGDPKLNLELYQGDSFRLGIVHPERDTIYCYDRDFDNFTCTRTEDLEREVNDLKKWMRAHCKE